MLDVLFQHRHRVFLLLHVEMCLGFDVDDSKVCACLCMCVEQRHVPLVKAVVLSGAEGGSEP